MVVQGLNPVRNSRSFCYPKLADWLWGLGPCSLVNGCFRAVSVRVRQPGHEADHSCLSTAEVKNE